MEGKIGGAITLLLGVFGAIYSANTIADDKSKWIGGYDYTAPLTSHEVIIIMILCISLLMILSGAILLRVCISRDGNQASGETNPTLNAVASMDIDPYTQLEKIAELHRKGVLSDDEFEKMKSEFLSKIH